MQSRVLAAVDVRGGGRNYSIILLHYASLLSIQRKAVYMYKYSNMFVQLLITVTVLTF